jgi:hypothetical protein
MGWREYYFGCSILQPMGHDFGAKKRKKKEKEQLLIQSH